MLLDGGKIFLNRIVDAKIDHLKTGTFHHHANEVFADIVNIALDSADDHFANFRRAGFHEQRPQNEHASLHCVGRHQYFRHEQNSIAEVDAHDAHSFHQSFGEDVIWCPFALDQNMNSIFDLFFETVVKIIVHLRDKIVVG